MTPTRTPEQRAAGARSLSNAVVATSRNGHEPQLRKSRTLIEALDDRCDGCPYETDCTVDRTCWRQERELEIEVGRYRKDERRRALGLGDGLAAGVHVVLPEEPHEPAQKLLETLGATYEVVEGEHPSHLTVVDELDRGRDLLDRMDAGVPVRELAREEAAVELPGAEAAAVSSSASPRAGIGPGPKWTKESAIAAIQQWAREHGRPPSSNDAKGNRALPSSPTCARLFGGWANLIEQAGFPRPTKGTRYKDSSGERAASDSGRGRPASTIAPERGPDEQEPGVEARTPAPPPTEPMPSAVILVDVGLLEDKAELYDTIARSAALRASAYRQIVDGLNILGVDLRGEPQ